MLDSDAFRPYFAPEFDAGKAGFGMANDPEHQKLDELAARIQKAQGIPADKLADASPGAEKGSNTGYELVGTILVCTLVGWLIDRYLHTKPWGILGMLVVGF